MFGSKREAPVLMLLRGFPALAPFALKVIFNGNISRMTDKLSHGILYDMVLMMRKIVRP